MIILQYLTRQLLQATLAVTTILLVIILSGRFVKYLAEAAAGKMDPSVLMAIMFYRLPGFLELIIPLGFFIAILMAYGRLYAEQEMTVLFSCGMSRKRLVFFTYIPACFFALLVGLFSVWLTPLGLEKAEQIITQQQNRSDFETIKPGRFQAMSSGRSVSYAESLSDNQKVLEEVFVATMGRTQQEKLVTVRARSAERIEHVEFKQRYMLLKEGIHYQGRPGQLDYRITEFESFGEYIKPAERILLEPNKMDLRSTQDLFGLNDLSAIAALQARFSAPILVLIISLLGVVMSHTTPRRGRYVMLFPSILLYLVYLVMLNAARGALEEGQLPPMPGLWIVHALFFIIALLLFFIRGGNLSRIFGRKQRPKHAKV